MSDSEELVNLTDGIRAVWAFAGTVSAEEEDAAAKEFDSWLAGVRAEAAAEQREKDAQIAEGYAEPIHPHHSMEKATARYVASLIRNHDGVRHD